jgi:hypothetical protein
VVCDKETHYLHISLSYVWSISLGF